MQSLTGTDREGLLQVTVPDTDLETTACPFCAFPGSTIIHAFPPHNIVRCGSCGLVYLNPRPKESVASRLYEGDGYFGHEGAAGYEDYASQEESLRITFRRFLGELDRLGMTGGSLLEVGCGYGYFLDEARRHFRSRAGLDLSLKAAARAREMTGADVRTGGPGALPAGEQFDQIIAINVIEHVYDPVPFLNSLYSRLSPGGWLALATPDIGSFWHRLLGRRWPSFKIPEHVAFYDAGTLSRLLAGAGLIEVRKIPFAHAFPLGLIAKKMGARLSDRLGRVPVWLPRTMVALGARRGHG